MNVHKQDAYDIMTDDINQYEYRGLNEDPKLKRK